MNLKTIALAAAAAAAATSASAADLPVVAEPVDYVQVCDAYGAGYFQLPGSDTCIRVAGRIRATIVSGDLAEDNNEGYEDHASYARGYIYLHSRTQSEIGLISTYTAVIGNYRGDASDDIALDDTYVQISNDLGAFTFGTTESVFYGFDGYSIIAPAGVNGEGESPLQVSYSKAFGNGVTAAIGLEDSSYRAGEDNSIDVTAAVTIEQGWGSFKLAGALHNTADRPLVDSGTDTDVVTTADEDDNGDLTGTYTSVITSTDWETRQDNDQDYGFALQATFTTGMLGEGTQVAFQAAYADSALSYLGFGGGISGLDLGDDADETAVLDAAGTHGYALAFGIEHALTDTVTGTIDASYMDLDLGDLDADYDRTAVDASVFWTPVSGLLIGAAAGWVNHDYDGGADEDELYVGSRVQFSF
ncbi:porin [Flexibacterium corallicola]|uniref:porin n=1 Tax=Flexibacterium corallicola TaxID=3037259 RepID=UPI00286F1760|nr:porin [Pseudovibrio sp. M1P-2-3]